MAELRESILLGIGNPLLDISATVEPEMLEKYEMNANGAILADEKHMPMYSELTQKYDAEFIAGGSVQNALRVAQWHLQKPNIATFFGCVGEDKNAQILEEKARSDGVNVRYQYTNKEPTGTCGVLVTGTNRSLCANLAAANCFTIDHVRKPDNQKYLDMAQYFYISGFFLTVSPPTVQEVAKFALSHERTFMMNLSAPFLCQFYSKPLMEAMPYVDILFGNESEADAFAKEQNFGTNNLKEIALKMCHLPKQNEKRERIVIITQGPNPVLLAHEGKITEHKVDPLPAEKMVDTNGAGDAFVGGFISQLIQGQPLDICIRCGTWTAGQIIQRSGCTFKGKPSFRP